MSHAPRRTIPGLHFLAIGFGAIAVMVLYNDRADSEKKESGTATVAGTHIEWEGWTINWSLRRLEGLVLTDVLYRGRKVLKYAGVAELFTAYDQGDPRPVDLSQNGLGEPRAPIVPGKDCSSGEWCKVLDAGGHELTKGAAPMVMIHEERTGPNYLGKFGRSPGKTLVLWSPGFFNGTIDGYTFVVRWKFHEDGMLIPEIGASGVPQHLKTGDSSPTGSFIGFNEQKEKVFAPSHVHNVLYRLDLDVDGEENTVEEFNREQQKSPNEKQALQHLDPAAAGNRPAKQPGDVPFVARGQFQVEERTRSSALVPVDPREPRRLSRRPERQREVNAGRPLGDGQQTGRDAALDGRQADRTGGPAVVRQRRVGREQGRRALVLAFLPSHAALGGVDVSADGLEELRADAPRLPRFQSAETGIVNVSRQRCATVTVGQYARCLLLVRRLWVS